MHICGLRLRKIAKRFAAIASPRWASPGGGAASTLHRKLKTQKKQLPKKELLNFLLGFKLNEMPCKIDDNSHRDGENHNLDNQMNGDVIVNTVA